MNQCEFEHLMHMARALCSGDYFVGFVRGLRRHYHGERFGTDDEHQLWLHFGLEGDTRVETGRGYRDGFAGNQPVAPEIDAAMIDAALR